MHLHGWYRKLVSNIKIIWTSSNSVPCFNIDIVFARGDWCGGDVLRFSLTKKLVVTIVHQSFKASRLRRLPSFGDFM
ncbi:hypothetical protein V6N13_135117 [Hibiscus sabdariffa]